MFTIASLIEDLTDQHIAITADAMAAAFAQAMAA